MTLLEDAPITAADEDLEGGTAVELYLAAPEGLTGSVVIDVGLVEV